MQFSKAFAVVMFCAATSALPALASPQDDIARAEAAMSKLHSYRATVLWSAGKQSAVSHVEMAAPDRYRSTTLGGQMEFVVIGARYWVRTTKQPWTPLRTAPLMSKIVDVIAVAHLDDQSRYSVSDLGMRGGYHTLLVKSISNASQTVVVYLRPDRLLSRVEIRAPAAKETITYSDYNAPISIRAPGM